MVAISVPWLEGLDLLLRQVDDNPKESTMIIGLYPSNNGGEGRLTCGAYNEGDVSTGTIFMFGNSQSSLDVAPSTSSGDPFVERMPLQSLMRCVVLRKNGHQMGSLQ